MNTCVGYKYAMWDKTKSGFLHPQGRGHCVFPIVIPVLPEAYYWIGSQPRPCGGRINRKTPLRNECAHYTKDKP